MMLQHRNRVLKRNGKDALRDACASLHGLSEVECTPKRRVASSRLFEFEIMVDDQGAYESASAWRLRVANSRLSVVIT